MAVNISIIKIKTDVTASTREDEAAEILRSQLERDFSNMPNVSGRICLLTNITFGGGVAGEIDILFLCDLFNCSILRVDGIVVTFNFLISPRLGNIGNVTSAAKREAGFDKMARASAISRAEYFRLFNAKACA